MDLKSEEEIRLLVCYNDYREFNQYRISLSSEVADVMGKINALAVAASHFTENDVKYDNPSFDKALEKLHDMLTSLQKNRSIYNKYVEEKQSHCEHEWSYDGNDSHYNYYKCTKCGKESKE